MLNYLRRYSVCGGQCSGYIWDRYHFLSRPPLFSLAESPVESIRRTVKGIAHERMRPQISPAGRSYQMIETSPLGASICMSFANSRAGTRGIKMEAILRQLPEDSFLSKERIFSRSTVKGNSE